LDTFPLDACNDPPAAIRGYDNHDTEWIKMSRVTNHTCLSQRSGPLLINEGEQLGH